MNMEFLTDKVYTDGFSMTYLRFGHGKTPLVILPGLSVQSMIPLAPVLVRQYKIFTEDFTVYVFDRRLEVPLNYPIREMAFDTVKVLQQLKLKDISLFGTSQGGMIAMVIAQEYPELVKRLVLCSTAMRIDEERFSVIADWIAFAQKKDREGLYLSIFGKVFPPYYFEQNKSVFFQMAKTVTEEELEHFIVLAEGIRNFTAEDKISCINCPVLLVGDEKDDVFGMQPTTELAKALCFNPHLETELYDGYGHALYDTAPNFKNRMYRFLTQC